MGTFMQSDPKNFAAANTIRENLGAAVDQIGCQASLNPDAQPVSYTHLTLPTNREV